MTDLTDTGEPGDAEIVEDGSESHEEEPTQPASETRSRVSLFEHPDAHPLALGLLLEKKYGSDWEDFETETLIAFSSKDDGRDATNEVSPTLRKGEHDKSHANAGVPPAVAFAQNQLGEVRTGEVLNTLNTNSNASGRNTPMVQQSMAVRRLTPLECARLQGFPDTYLSQVTYRKRCPPADGPMYRALGNSMAVNCMRWLGERIAEVDAGGRGCP